MSRAFVCCTLALLLTPAAVVAEPLLLEVERATAGFDRRTGVPAVDVQFTEQAKRRFGQFTTDHVGRKVEFRIDGQTVTKPVLRTPILGGKISISDNLSIEWARDIAARLSSGAKIEVEVLPE